MGDVIQLPGKFTRCARCNKRMIAKGNKPAYCDYTCAAEAQPEHTLSVRQSTAQQ